jgi:peptide methionine sulfoxide reductase MsrA
VFNPIVTEVKPVTDFYEAEDYHQDYVKQSQSALCERRFGTAIQQV